MNQTRAILGIPLGVKSSETWYYSGLIDQSACKPSQDSHQQDLCIAWRSAVATEAQAFWARIACLVGVFGIFFVVRTLHYTGKAAEYTRIAAEAAQASAQAAESSVAESAKTLAHAQDVAERDLRPWLTIEASLDSKIAIDALGSIRSRLDGVEKFEFFVQVKVENLDRSAARNVICLVTAKNFAGTHNPTGWFYERMQEAVDAVRACVPSHFDSNLDFSDYNETLAPSERYESRRWCQFGEEMSTSDVIDRYFEICVSVVAAYRGATEEEVFCTAKLFPVGFPDIPVFFRYINRDSLPIGTGDIAFGPVRKGLAT